MDNLEEKACGNCEHWSGGNTYITTTAGQILKGGTCAVNAHDIDAPQHAVMLTENSHCLCAQDGCQFQPSKDYLNALADSAEFARNPASYNGVKPGIDFPATL